MFTVLQVCTFPALHACNGEFRVQSSESTLQGFAASSFQISGFCRHPNSWGVLSVYSSAFSMSDFAPDVQGQIGVTLSGFQVGV